MSEDQVQVSAYVSATTKARLDEFARETGLKKGYVIETALETFIASAEAIPAEYAIPTRIVLSNESYDRVVDLMTNPPEPTEELKRLMRGEIDADQAPPGF